MTSISARSTPAARRESSASKSSRVFRMAACIVVPKEERGGRSPAVPVQLRPTRQPTSSGQVWRLLGVSSQTCW